MKNFRILTAYPRAAGVTTILAKVSKVFVEGYVVCANEIEARRVAHDHNCKAVSVRDPDRMRGLSGVKLWEPLAIDYLMQYYEDEISELKNKHYKSQEESERFRAWAIKRIQAWEEDSTGQYSSEEEIMQRFTEVNNG